MLEVGGVLDTVGIEYSVVSGYVAVLFGRSRATEDIGVITERFDDGTADELAKRLREAGHWGSAMPLDDLHETLADDLPARIAEEGPRIPNVELKFASDESDRISLDNAISVRLGGETLRVGSLSSRLPTSSIWVPRRTTKTRSTSTKSRGQVLIGRHSKGAPRNSGSKVSTNNSEDRDDKHARNRQERLRRIREWAAYVRTHRDEDWGKQVNTLVNSQLQSARHLEDERPDRETFKDSPLLNS